jgi:hypothetical protein
LSNRAPSFHSLERLLKNVAKTGSATQAAQASDIMRARGYNYARQLAEVAKYGITAPTWETLMQSDDSEDE